MDLDKREQMNQEKRDKTSYKTLYKTEDDEQEQMHFWIDMIQNDSGYEPERIARLGPKQGKGKVD